MWSFLSLLVFIVFTFHYVSIKSFNFSNLRLNSITFTFHYVSIKSIIGRTNSPKGKEFTFHYVSIKSQGVIEPNIDFATFTFHYVSIKSGTYKKRHNNVPEFTFNYVSIKSPAPPPVTTPIIHLHSTMYLLNLSVIVYTSLNIVIYIPLCIY